MKNKAENLDNEIFDEYVKKTIRSATEKTSSRISDDDLSKIVVEKSNNLEGDKSDK